MGLMDMFSVRDIRSFGTGLLGARVEAMQESARVKAEQKKAKDQLLGEKTKALDIHAGKLLIDNEDKERIRNIESNLLQAQYGDMDEDVFKYLLAQGYFYNKTEWDAFSEPFEEAGGGQKWYKSRVVGTNQTWEDMVAERLKTQFNNEDAKNITGNENNIGTYSKDALLEDVEIPDSKFNLWDSKSISPTAQMEWETSVTELQKKKQELAIGDIDLKIAQATEADRIALLSIDLTKAQLSVAEQEIVNRIAKATETDEIAIKAAARKIQDEKLSMIKWDSENYATIQTLGKDIKEQQKSLNDNAIKLGTYNLETQPKKDLIAMQIDQANLLSTQITNSTLRQKNSLVIKQLQEGINASVQKYGIVEMMKDKEFEKLTLTVDNLRLDNEMQEIMNTAKPAMLILEKEEMQLDNLSKKIDNKTAAEIDQATLDNIKGRNVILEKDIGSYDQKTQNAFELHKARIAEIEAKLKEKPTITGMYDQKKLTDTFDLISAKSLGVPTSGNDISGYMYDYKSLRNPWIEATKTNSMQMANNEVLKIQTAMREDPSSEYFDLAPQNINVTNIANRNLATGLLQKFALDNANAVNYLVKKSELEGSKLEPSQKRDISALTLVLFKGSGTYKGRTIDKEEAGTILNDTFNIDTADVFETVGTGDTIGRSTDSPWNAQMLQLISNLNQGLYDKSNDIYQ